MEQNRVLSIGSGSISFLPSFPSLWSKKDSPCSRPLAFVWRAWVSASNQNPQPPSCPIHFSNARDTILEDVCFAKALLERSTRSMRERVFHTFTHMLITTSFQFILDSVSQQRIFVDHSFNNQLEFQLRFQRMIGSQGDRAENITPNSLGNNSATIKFLIS